MENPCRGVKKNKEQPRDVYVTDEVWKALYEKASDDLRVTMDLAYLTGQRPADVRKLRKSDVSGDYLLVGQNKTSRKLRIRLRRADGQMTQLGRLIESITSDSPALVTNEKGQPMTEKMLRTRFDTARKAAAEEAIKAGDQDLARRSCSSSSGTFAPRRPPISRAWPTPQTCSDTRLKRSRNASTVGSGRP